MPTIHVHAVSRVAIYLSFAEREEIAMTFARVWCPRHCPKAWTSFHPRSLVEFRRNAATRSGGFNYRATTAQWHADRRARRPKVAKLAKNEALRTWVQERLAGRVCTPDGLPVAGPHVARWNGRRHGPRKDRRWVKAWSPSSRSRAGFPSNFQATNRCVSPMKQFIRLSTFRPAGHSAANSSPVFEPAEHLEYRGLGHVIAAASSFRRSC